MVFRILVERSMLALLRLFFECDLGVGRCWLWLASGIVGLPLALGVGDNVST